jgi:hypothetical protein
MLFYSQAFFDDNTSELCRTSEIVGLECPLVEIFSYLYYFSGSLANLDVNTDSPWIHHKRLSQHCFTMRATYMDWKGYCQSSELNTGIPIETEIMECGDLEVRPMLIESQQPSISDQTLSEGLDEAGLTLGLRIIQKLQNIFSSE